MEATCTFRFARMHSGVNLIGINRTRPLDVRVRLISGHSSVGAWAHSSSRGFEIKNPFAWCDGFEKLHPGVMYLYLPTYTKDVLYILVDLGEAEEAGALLAAPGNSPLRFASSTCLSGGAKKFGAYDLKKTGAPRVPLSRFYRRLCNG